MDELKARFVCGKKTKYHNLDWSRVPQVSCNNSWCIIFGLWFTVDEWNKPRPIEDALKAELAALREQTRWRKWPDEWSGINGDYQVVKQSRTLGSYYEDTVYLYPPLARDQNLFHGDPVVFYRENQPLP